MAEKRIAMKSHGELEAVAREVTADQEARILELDGIDVAVVVPIETWRRSKEWNPSPEDIERSLSSAGGWHGLVDDDLAEQVMRWRHEQPIRPPVVW